jgi:hypothetical protein
MSFLEIKPDASGHVIEKSNYRLRLRLNLVVQLFYVMALPDSLRFSVTPPELELIASQELVEIVPLISMERTAFISV